jgi:TolA-binding protein
MMTYGALGLLSVFALGLLVARDVAHLVAHRVEQFIFDEDLEGERDPEYEQAEKVWADGQPLEAIQIMRNYLKEHPREQYVALRIAEIYEKDLGNYVAATLEYEDIIKKNLPPERWGWAAIHLANLYSGKLNKPEQAAALLRRIIAEYPQIAAAKKARERLGEPEPVPEPEPQPDPASQEQKRPASNLPPGFRPK